MEAEAADGPGRPAHGLFYQLIVAAIQARSGVVQIAKNITETSKVPLQRSLCIEVAPDASQSPKIQLPGLFVAGENTKVTLRGLTFESSSPSGVLLEVMQGASLELVDCKLVRGGLRLHPGTETKLRNTYVEESPGFGVSSTGARALVMQSCGISGCQSDGLRLEGPGGEVEIENCTIQKNDGNGVVVGSTGNGNWFIRGSTLSKNLQYGIWADGTAIVSWGQNSVLGNGIAEKGGKGHLEGWLSGIGFRPGDNCHVWSVECTGWLAGRVDHVTSGSVRVVAKVPRQQRAAMLALRDKQEKQRRRDAREAAKSGEPEAPVQRRMRAKTTPSVAGERLPICVVREVRRRGEAGVWLDLTVRPNHVRQPESGDRICEDTKKKTTPQGIFFREGGNLESWQALSTRDKKRLEARAKKERLMELAAKDPSFNVESKKKKLEMAVSMGLFTSAKRAKSRRRW